MSRKAAISLVIGLLLALAVNGSINLPDWLPSPTPDRVSEAPIDAEGFHVLVVSRPSQQTTADGSLINSVKIRDAVEARGGVFRAIDPDNPPANAAYRAAVGNGFDQPMILLSNSTKGGELLPLRQVNLQGFLDAINRWGS